MVFTEHVAADTHYYFSVQDEAGEAFGFSQGYKLSAKPVARRLYGASLVI